MNTQPKFELLLGEVSEGKLCHPKTVGSAFLQESEKCYSVKLMALPGITFYLVKNQESTDRYTLYAKKQKGEDRTHFIAPVGMGRLREDLNSYLELYIPTFKLKTYMCLFPKNS
jgi:hypothetical protein